MRAWLIAALTAALSAGCGDHTGRAPERVPPAATPSAPAAPRAPTALSSPAAPDAPVEPGAPSAPSPYPKALPEHHVFDTAAEALHAIFERDDPQVIGFGEYHQTVGNERVPSALHRFDEQLLAPLAARATDLVVETWAEYGNCGEAETKVSKDVKRDTERPPQTESEVVGLLRHAKQLGMEPHYLPFSCDDYRALLGDDGQVDYEKLLLLITQRLQTAATDLAAKGKVVALYGGSTHNDLYPYASVEDLSYAHAVRERTEGRYVEVDLYVPELVAGDKLLSTEAWYPLLQHASPDHVILIERGAQSYILLMRTTPSAKAAAHE